MADTVAFPVVDTVSVPLQVYRHVSAGSRRRSPFVSPPRNARDRQPESTTLTLESGTVPGLATVSV
jgi:hypothetical protein